MLEAFSNSTHTQRERSFAAAVCFPLSGAHRIEPRSKEAVLAVEACLLAVHLPPDSFLLFRDVVRTP